MINYLVNFTLCSALLLAAYHMLLKNKTTYVFNRFYLLLAVTFSLTVPFIVITRTIIPVEPINSVQELTQSKPGYIIQNPGSLAAPVYATRHQPAIDYIPYIITGLYIIITLLLLYRFAKNLNTIRRSVLNSESVGYKTARLILMNEKLTPHTFLNSIFINKEEYNSHKVEADVLEHELTHARQRHSADVIFIELVQAICWFNPFIMFYRKAIQLNHEFIADAAVLKGNSDIQHYQYLLLGNINNIKSLSITSQFNYSVTKKRLIMMSKTTSATAAMLARLAIIPVMTIAFILFCTKTEAQRQPAANKEAAKPKAAGKVPIANKAQGKVPTVIVPDYPSTKEGASEEALKKYAAIVDKYNNLKVHFTKRKVAPGDYDSLVTIYKQMSREQQRKQILKFIYYKQPFLASPPKQKDYELWKNADMYGVWINEKHVDNAELDKYKASDFKMSFVSRLLKAARVNKKYMYQVDLMTVDYFDKLNKETMENPPITIIQYGFMKGKSLFLNHKTPYDIISYVKC